MVGEEALDNPYWHAMTGPHARVAIGTGKARRYPAHIGPVAALAEPSEEAFADLERLVEPGETVGFVRAEPAALPARWSRVFGVALEQRVCRRLGPWRAAESTPLTEEDIPAMLALAEATEPGPFERGALALGDFLGVWEGSRLVAMAGVRAHLEGFREITAVCTVPERRGRGLASGLVGQLSSAILASGETPFLHVRTDNASAIHAYARLGFELRRPMQVQAIRLESR
ncbi:MAG: GNAT family N-acetyltransferase [Deinococcales bacterium]